MHSSEAAEMNAIRQPSDVNVTALIDERPMGGLQWLVFVLCALAALLDGADSQSIGVAAPLIATQLGITMGSFTPAFSAGLLGATIGALTFGGLGDRFGRKRMLVLAVLMLSTFTLLTAVAQTFPELLVIRFLGGLGLGGATPCFITLCAEYAPRRRRALLTSVLWAAYPLGASLGSIVNATVIPALGWPAVFYIGGGLPLIVAILMAFLLPESLDYLVTRDAASPRAMTIVRRLDRSRVGEVMRLVADTEKVVGAGVGTLFSQGRTIGTVLLWLVMFMAFGTTTIIVLISPTLFKLSGLSLSTAALLVGVSNFVGVAGMASAGYLVQRFGALVLVPAFWIGAATLAIMGSVASSPVLAAICMALLGVTVLLGGSGGIALAAISYPTSIRSTGVGWAMGMARFGQVCSPLLVGPMLGHGWGAREVLGVMSLLPVFAGVFVLIRTLHARRAGQPVVV
jgi:MFS transporter, AAHS family, 4-hydroxybenzoate transporter